MLIKLRASEQIELCDLVDTDFARRNAYRNKIAKMHSQLKSITRELTIFKRRANARTRHNLTASVFRAWNHRNMSEVAKLSRLIAGTSIGVRNRNYRVFPRLASKEEWAIHLTKDARDGGLTATLIDTPGFADYSKPDRGTDWITAEVATESSIQTSADDANIGKRDLALTASRLKTVKRRKYVPHGPSPGKYY